LRWSRWRCRHPSRTRLHALIRATSSSSIFTSHSVRVHHNFQGRLLVNMTDLLNTEERRIIGLYVHLGITSAGYLLSLSHILSSLFFPSPPSPPHRSAGSLSVPPVSRLKPSKNPKRFFDDFELRRRIRTHSPDRFTYPFRHVKSH